jgi:chromosome segregation ATPase
MLWLSDQQWNYVVAMLTRIDRNTTALYAASRQMEKEMSAVSDAVDELKAQVDANTSQEASAVAAIQRLADLIDQNTGDPTALRTLVNKLKTSADALGAAISNTSGAPSA